MLLILLYIFKNILYNLKIKFFFDMCTPNPFIYAGQCVTNTDGVILCSICFLCVLFLNVLYPIIYFFLYVLYVFQTEIGHTDLCSPSPCKNGGQCTTNSNGNFECHCPNGFTGIVCEVGKCNQ